MTQSSKQGSWSYGSILFWGVFGTHTPAARRYWARCGVALLVFAGATVAGFSVPRFAPAIWPVCAAAWFFTLREFWRYAQSLDELEQRLQMEAMAWTYLLAIGAAVTLGTLAQFMHWSVSPWVLVMLEPVRGWRLYVLARRRG